MLLHCPDLGGKIGRVYFALLVLDAGARSTCQVLVLEAGVFLSVAVGAPRAPTKHPSSGSGTCSGLAQGKKGIHEQLRLTCEF